MAINSSVVPLDPDLFNPEVVGTNLNQQLTDQTIDDNWDLDQNDLDYETEDEEDEDDHPIKTKTTNSRLNLSTLYYQNPEDDHDDDDDEDEDEDGDDDDDDDDSSDEDDADQERNSDDLRRLIGAIHAGHPSQDSISKGLLGQEWDQSMEQELNELKEAEEAIKPGSKRKFKLRGEPELSVEVSILLGKANLCFIEKNYDEAIPLFENILRIEPMCKMAWNNLGAIYQDIGDFERSSQFRIIAAHLTAKPAEIWKELASESRQHGLLSQAIYCYSEAIKAGKNDVESMWDRSYLLFELGRPRQALAGYLSILKITPHNPDVLREVAQLCATTDEKEQPIKLFQEALKHYQSVMPSPSEQWLSNGFGYEHVLILVQLLMKSRPALALDDQVPPGSHSNLEEKEQIHRHYQEILKLIKQATRWLQARSDANSPGYLNWDLLEDDREYDPVRQIREGWENLPDSRYEESPTYPLENALRVSLGICRLHLGDEEEAALHFDLIKELGSEEKADFYMSIGDAYVECSQWDEALDFYHDLAENDSTNNPSLWHKIGKCYRKLENFEGALECFEAVSETDPLDLVAKTQLAELYEQLGQRDKALAMVDDLIQLRRRARESGVVIDNESTLGETGGSNPFQTKSHNVLAMRTTASKSLAERRLDEELRTQKYVKTYEKLEAISSKLATDSPDSLFLLTEYVRLANPLIEGFRQTSALFPSALGAKFSGLHLTPARPGKRGENIPKTAPNSTETDHSVSQEFRGIRFSNWVRIFVYYAFSCAKMKRADEASEVLNHVMRAPTFRQSAPMQQVLRLAYAASCYAKGDFTEVVETIRWLSRMLPFHNDPIRLMSAILCRGYQASIAFFNANTQKWLLRQLQLIDGHIGKPQSNLGDRNSDDHQEASSSQQIKKGPGRSGQANKQPKQSQEARMEREMLKEQEEAEDDDESYWKPSKFRPTKMNPIFIIVFAQILSGSRSFKSAIVYYLRIYELYPDEPLLNLLLAVAYVQRAMQRQTDNRHHQIVQALAFLDQYRELRQRDFGQEVEYNLGRLYHGLGLTTLAVFHYNRALNLAPQKDNEDTESSSPSPAESDLSNLAAYNLMLIYSTSGSPDLAHRLACDYLSV